MIPVGTTMTPNGVIVSPVVTAVFVSLLADARWVQRAIPETVTIATASTIETNLAVDMRLRRCAGGIIGTLLTAVKLNCRERWFARAQAN